MAVILFSELIGDSEKVWFICAHCGKMKNVNHGVVIMQWHEDYVLCKPCYDKEKFNALPETKKKGTARKKAPNS